MNSMKNYILIIFLSISHLVIASGVENDFNITEVAQGNYLHKGIHVTLDDINHDDIANIGFIIGDKCIAVIDTGGSIDIGLQLLKKIKSISDKPICYVINTHVHFDHMLGNRAFTLENPEFVGHHQLAAEVERNREFFLEQFKNDLGPNPVASSIIGPTILVDKSRQLDLGDRVLTLIPFPASHSHSDLIIIDNKTNTLWAGDLIFRERIPSLTGSLIGWIKVIADLTHLEGTLVIPGHGNVAESMSIAIKQEREYLQRLLDETRQAIEDGQFVNEAAENIDKDNLSNWLLFDFQHPTNVSRAFTELEWE
ncbi:MAG: quinoprotein relay system zinc metallohydrolase 2 [Gammaproteobacteria bacterium]|jgi:quinoprotein relay system zinc metallohydrolase 2